MSRQAQLGIFAVVALALLFGVFYVITDFGARHNGYPMAVHFRSSSGLPTGSQVFFAGVTVGTVDRIVLLGDDTVDVYIAIQNVRIPKGSRFTIQAPITGTPNLYIIPPVPAPLPPGQATPAPYSEANLWPKYAIANVADQPQGETPKSLSDFMDEGQKEFKRLDSMLALLQEREPRLLDSMDTALENVSAITTQLRGTTADLSGVMETDLTRTGNNIAEMTDTLNGTLTRNQYKIDQMLSSLDATAVALNRSMDALQGYATDPRLKKNLIATTDNIRDLTANMAGITGDLHDVTSNAQTKEQLLDIFANLDATMQKADSLLGKLGGKSRVYGVDAGVTPAPVSSPLLLPPGTQTPAPAGSHLSLGSGLGAIAKNFFAVQARFGELSPQRVSGSNPLLGRDRGPQADLNALIFPHGSVEGFIGANDIGGYTTLNLAALKKSGNLRYGGGILYSQIGALAQYDGKVLGAQTRIYNLRSPSVDVYGNVKVSDFAKLFYGERDVTHPDRRTVYGLQLQF